MEYLESVCRVFGEYLEGKRDKGLMDSDGTVLGCCGCCNESYDI